MPRLVVLGDSLTFHGPVGPVPLTDPGLFPNQIAQALPGDPWDAVVVARAGWGVRESWLALQRDVHLQQQVLLGADAVVFAVGSVDSLPVGIPRGVLATLPFVRPTRLRRRLRREIDRVHPALVRATRGRLRYTPLEVYRHGWRKSIEAVRLFTRDAPIVAVLPAVHHGDYYAGNHRHHPEVRDATLELAAVLDVPLIDLAALAEPHRARFNPDGLHWPFELHAEVAAAAAAALIPQLTARGRPAS